MKCPICGQELKQGKKDPNYLLCYNCKKKFKVPQKSIERNEEDDDDEEEQRYSIMMMIMTMMTMRRCPSFRSSSLQLQL